MEVLGRSTRHSRKMKLITKPKVPSFTFATANLAVGLPLAGNGKLPLHYNDLQGRFHLSFLLAEVLGRSTRHNRKTKSVAKPKMPSFTFATANLAVGLPLAGNGKLPLPYNDLQDRFHLSFLLVEVLGRSTRHSRKTKLITKPKVPSFIFATANLAVGLPLAGNGKLPSPHNNIKICFICGFTNFICPHLNVFV